MILSPSISRTIASALITALFVGLIGCEKKRRRSRRGSSSSQDKTEQTAPDPAQSKPAVSKPDQPTNPTPPKQTPPSSLDDWVATQSWFKKLASQMPAGVNLSTSTSAAEKSGWKLIQIREIHTPESGFDPNVSPLVATFRISPNRNTTEWLDPISGDWASLSSFEKSRTPDSQPDAQKPRKLGPPPKLAANELAADIDKDGRYEIVRWSPFGSSEFEKFFQLTVIDDDGKTLWSGPKVKDASNPLVFFEADHGVSLPTFLHDINGDGHVELLAPEPQGDVSPIFYRRLTWKQGKFHKLGSCSLMLSSPAGKSFQWKTSDTYHGIWIHNLGPVNAQGLVNGMVISATKKGDVEQGTVLVRFNAHGATIEKWIKPIKGASSPQVQPKSPNKPTASGAKAGKTEDDLLYAKTRDDYYDKKIPAAEAFATFMMLAKRGHIDSVYAVGYLYYLGEGVQKDYKQAHRWISQAAEKGKPKALFRLGYMYGKGLGVTKDEDKAMEYYLPAAKAGNNSAAFYIGLAYDYGRGVEIDKAQACVWYRKAAKLGSASAMCNLGNGYYRGEGVELNYQLARRWLLCSAARGSEVAANSLGVMYAFGKGVEKDQYLACQWWAVAARGGYSKSATKIEDMAIKQGWTNHELSNFPLPKEMADAKKGNLPALP